MIRSNLSFGGPRLRSGRIGQLFYKVMSILVACTFIVYFALFLFVPVDRKVSVDNRPDSAVKVYTRLYGHAILIVEPAVLDGSMYIYFPESDIGQMKTGQTVKVSTGIFRLFGGLSYFTPFPDVNSIALLDGDDSINSMLVESPGRQISFQDDSNNVVVVR